MLQTAKPSRIAVPSDHSEVPGWLDSTSISGMPPTSSRASSPIVVNTWRSWRWTATDRRYRCRMKPYQAAERATSSQPATPPVGSLRRGHGDGGGPGGGHQAGGGEPDRRCGSATRAAGPARPARRTAQHRRRAAGPAPGVTGSCRGVHAGPRRPGAESACAFTEQDDANGGEQDQQVEQQAAVLHVVEVIGQLLAGVLDRRAIRIVHLCPAGDARLDVAALADRAG